MNFNFEQLLNENKRLLNLCSVLEKMNEILNKKHSINCKNCFEKNNKLFETKLNVLKIKYNFLKNQKFAENLDEKQKNLEKIVIKKNNIKLKKAEKGKQKPETNRLKRLKCDWIGCQLLFRDRQDLENHRWRHTGQKLFLCDWPGCEKQFSSQCYLKKHVAEHVNPNPYKCLHVNCERVFSELQHLNDHYIDEHFGKKPSFLCDWPECDKRFNTKWNLSKHEKKDHLLIKEVKCDDCSEMFTHYQQLVVHKVNVHNCEKPFQCDWPGCEFTTCYRGRLITHKRRHTGEKPFDCEKCKQSFRMKSHLKAHSRVHLREKSLQCLNCEQIFQTKKSLQIHIENSH